MNMKNIAMWAIIVFLTIGLYNMFKNPQSNQRGVDKVIDLVRAKSSFKVTLGGCLIKKVNGTVILSKE